MEDDGVGLTGFKALNTIPNLRYLRPPESHENGRNHNEISG